ncbi:MAG TPA: hypothetical protein VEK15_04725 [Vicinamibacteria bacterium]|nr:hypothetical protein [Vicinamibacteria bacterium]
MLDETDIWSYIPVADFEVPSPPASDAARGLARRLWTSLRDAFHRPNQKASSEEVQLDRPPVDRLRSVTPDPDWKPAADLLAAELGDDWFDNRRPARPLQVLIGPPGCDVAEVLEVLAQKRQLNVLTAPSPEVLLEASYSNLSELHAVQESIDEILVIPHLERWYLRHQDGLSVVRTLVQRLNQNGRRVLVGCDSWAWAFLQHAIGVQDRLGAPITLASFDPARLDAWFRSTFDTSEYEFRQSGDGESVFPELDNTDKTDTERPRREKSMTIRSLAATARGNPGVALALWRASLRTRDTGQEPDPSAQTSRPVLWVVSPAQFALPELPVDADRVDRFVLHSVLLHGGLSLSSLVTLLPFSCEQVQRSVSLMRRVGMIEEQMGRLCVTLTAYPLVRRDLLSGGLLTDSF